MLGSGAVLVYLAGKVALGAGHIWVVSEVTYVPVMLPSYGGVMVAGSAFLPCCTPAR